jgi:hypothetical protein
MDIFNGQIEFDSEAEFHSFIKDIDKPNAIVIIEEAFKYVTKSGYLNMHENYVIYSCLKKLKENEV